ncbi:MAG: serine/threonine protein kinase [Polyangiaceae bacterium]|nr:serine/threonine protein kinase [Polyangiaceae bacterium]
MNRLPPHTQRTLEPPAAPLHEEAGDLVPGMLVGGHRYRLDRLIAVGGMGTVWAGWDLQLDRVVAVKFMAARVAHSSLLRQRFTREAKAAAGLRTPHVVQIFDYGVDLDRPFMVMELLEGEDLNTRLKRVGRLPMPEVARIADQAAKALRRAHESGVVHRDLKPQNIFLARSDDDEVVKVLDFGIAKMNDPLGEGESTRTGVVMGSPHFMSPEQARGMRDVDQRSDLWSLGVILFRALTGELVFRGEATGDVIVRICCDPLPQASLYAPELGPAMDAFFARALARPVSERFQTAVELAQAFQQAVAATSGASALAGRTQIGHTGPSQAGAAVRAGALPQAAGAWGPGGQHERALHAPPSAVAPGAPPASGVAHPHAWPVAPVASPGPPLEPGWSSTSSSGTGLAAVPGTSPGTLTNATGELEGSGRRRVRLAAVILGGLALTAATVAALVIVAGGSTRPAPAPAATVAAADRAASARPEPTSAVPAPEPPEAVPPVGTPDQPAEPEPAPEASVAAAASSSAPAVPPPGAKSGAVAPPAEPKPLPKASAKSPSNWGY